MGEQKVFLPCGKDEIEITLPEDVVLLESAELKPIPEPVSALEGILSSPVGTPPLSELARGRKDACLVISDQTRPVPNHLILPALLKILAEAGIGRDNIKLLIATGMHRPCREAEIVQLVGPEIAANYQVINHDCHSAEDCREVCTIEEVAFEMNRHYLDADLKILTGLVEPHFYAGFSGGRKSLVPGISSLNTLQFMHCFAMINHPMVANCMLDDNPFHQFALQAARQAGVDFIVNAVLNKQRQPVFFAAGDLEQAHHEACDLVFGMALARVGQPLDLVITSAGGHPLDSTFYQVSKGLVGAAGILQDGGTILIVGGCAEGLGSPEFSAILKEGLSVDEFAAAYSAPETFVLDQWCAQSIYQVLGRAGRVLVYSPGVERQDLERIGMEKVEDLNQTIAELITPGIKAAVIPEGPYLVGLVNSPDII